MYEGECNALRDECRAISEDLEVLVKENQVVNHQLTTVTTERCEQPVHFSDNLCMSIPAMQCTGLVIAAACDLPGTTAV